MRDRVQAAVVLAMVMSMTEREDRLHDALQQLVDWVKDGCAEEGYLYTMTEAQMALKDLKVVRGADEVSRLRTALEEIKTKGVKTGYGRTALAAIARRALGETSPTEKT